MTILALRGRANCGKTTTLRYLLDIFKANGAEVICEESLDKKGSDCRAKLIFCGKAIFLTTRGDNGDNLEEDYLSSNGCDLFICAARENGDTPKFVWAKGDPWIMERKWKLPHSDKAEAKTMLNAIDETERDFINKAQAEHLFRAARSIITEGSK